MNITLTPIITAKPQYNKQSPNITKTPNHNQANKMGEFPKYYCPNINFRSRFGEIDFEFDFYAKADSIIKNHLDDMELTKNLNKAEQNHFRNSLFSSDKPTLLHFFYDKKPSILLTSNYPYLKNNEKYDFVRRTIVSPLRDGKTVKTKNTFIINRELTKQTIAENKELYSKRMGFDESVSVDDIYKKLIGKDSPLKKQTGYDDIIGITLGFSPINSILFQLENDIPNKLEVRQKRNLHSELMNKKFNSEDSPYKDFSEDFKAEMSQAISNSKEYFKIPDIDQIGYGYIHFTPDDEHNNKIIKNAEEILKQI